MILCVCFTGFHIGDGSGYHHHRYGPAPPPPHAPGSVNGYAAAGYYMAPDMDIKMDPEVMEMYHQHQNHHANQTPSPMGGYPSPGSADYAEYGAYCGCTCMCRCVTPWSVMYLLVTS